MKLDPLYFFLPMIEALDREEHDLVGATVGHGKRDDAQPSVVP